ncbi:MAG: hypothetical protein M1833_000959 [Piccolia ochrophora]|nr:MAG: hypothetical protein M1833_000959 [Piccolia ochrophora]
MGSNEDTAARSSVTGKVRMLVLETDEPHPETVHRRGTYGAIFDELFTKAGAEHDPPLGIDTIMTYVVEPDGGKVPELDDIGDVHAILVTGSMYDAHGDDDWILKLVLLLRRLWVQRPDIRFSGVCFGHQILCRALRSKLEPTPGGEWELAHTELALSSVGQRLFRTDDTAIELHQVHQDRVVDAPSSATSDLLSDDVHIRIWGGTEHTPIQGVYMSKRLFTSQGHLGFDAATVKRQVQDRVDSGGIECSEEAELAKMTAHMEHDGLVVAAAILRFFHGEDDDI